MITIEYILPADDLHRLALKRRFQLSICRLLTSAALGVIAEIDIKKLHRKNCSYSNHRVQSPYRRTQKRSMVTSRGRHEFGQNTYCSYIRHHRREPCEIFITSPRKSSSRGIQPSSLATSSSQASRNLHCEPPEIIIAHQS
jgi:hypothetical protein